MLFIFFGVFGLLLFIVLLARSYGGNYMGDDEVVTTTTTTEDNGPDIVGNLNRERENNQFFVIDPVDKTKNWLNDKDDMYEDAAGKIWRLV